jgi:hypothetical protein
MFWIVLRCLVMIAWLTVIPATLVYPMATTMGVKMVFYFLCGLMSLLSGVAVYQRYRQLQRRKAREC